jgi:hypothetical protein
MSTGDQEHLDWLVKSRSATQSVAVKLHGLLEANKERFKGNKKNMVIARQLIAASFSLWRAVFLSNKTAGYEPALVDGIEFLKTMIEDNAIGYTQDKKYRNWTFDYYVRNAGYHLRELSRESPDVLEEQRTKHKGKNPKTHWETFQSAFTLAVDNFQARLMAGR